MGQISSKSYDAFVGKLEMMADGVKKHEGNAKISANFQEAEIKALKEDLETLRGSYLSQETETRKAFDAFAEKFNEVQAVHAGGTRIVKGLLGRTSETLKDFGISPEKAKPRKAKPKA
jgi:hypothetical protein